ncbi:putative RNA-binding S4 domain-containing protein [Helianthus annuus]|nr:putative RNA-binding S4 domain-containing protein [Helianthus annuus]
MWLMSSLTHPPLTPASRTLTNSLISFFINRTPPIRNLIHQRVSFNSNSTASNLDDEPQEDPRQRTNYAGVRLAESVEEAGKMRLDAWISNKISGVSRARVQSSIKEGLVSVNHRVVVKVNVCICCFNLYQMLVTN